MPALPPIPGYAEAVQKERELRDAAFLDVPEFILGVSVKPLTLDHLIRLNAVKSPFTIGGRLSIETLPIDVCVFLWNISPEFREIADSGEQRKRDIAAHQRFVRSLRKLDFLKAIAAIDAYIDAAFFDAPKGTRGGISYYSWIASLILSVSKATNWDPEKIRATPVKQLWQYLRAASSAKLFNPSDKIRADWLAKLNAGEVSLQSAAAAERGKE